MKAKVEGHKHLVKDTRTGIILNTNVDEMETYNSKKASFRAARLAEKTINTTEERLDAVESDMKEIKQLLRTLIDNGHS